MKKKWTIQILCMLGILLMFSSCYHRRAHHQMHAAMVEYSNKQLDSISFSTTHHYTNKFNFLVFKNCLLVVTDIRMVPQDSIDSVWVQLATEDNQFGWTRESRLLPKVVPDDPISEFIMTFSNTHLLIFMVIIILIAVAYTVRKIFHSNGKLVHFNDIDSPYPTALVLIVSISATFYATIQLFLPEVWRHFYFHPTLNPFAVPPILGFFLATVWAILIVGLACVDEVKHRLPAGDAVLYLGGLVGVCAIDYIIFSVTTLYYIGYLLLVAYIWFAIRVYLFPHK